MDYKKKYLKYKLKYLNQKYRGGSDTDLDTPKSFYTPSSKIPKGLEQKIRNLNRKEGKKDKNKYKTPPLPPWYVIPGMLVQPDPNVGTPMLPLKNTKLEQEPWGSSDEESELNFLQEDPLTTEPNEYTKRFIKKLKKRVRDRGKTRRDEIKKESQR